MSGSTSYIRPLNASGVVGASKRVARYMVSTLSRRRPIMCTGEDTFMVAML